MACLHSAQLLFLVALSLIITCQAGCPNDISLPQDEPVERIERILLIEKKFHCRAERAHSLNHKRGIYSIKKATPEMPYNRLGMDASQYGRHLNTNPFLLEHSILWIGQAVLFRTTESVYLLANQKKGQNMKMEEYAQAREFFRIHTSSAADVIKIFTKHSLATVKQIVRNFLQWISDMNLTKVIPGLDKLIAVISPVTQKRVDIAHIISQASQNLVNVKDMLIRFMAQVLEHFSPTKDLLRNPSASPAPFQSDLTAWISDHFFAEQRLSGFNPMTIEKVTIDNSHGMPFDELKKLLNPAFNLVGAVDKVLGHVTDMDSLRKAVRDGHLFVLYHRLNKYVHSSSDLTDKDPKRKLMDFKSPIAIFASARDNAALKPVAIQIDDKTDAPVYTPQDGDLWMLAKLTTQQSDYTTSQVVEHLCKTHFTVEPFCLAVERHLSPKHPLFDMMRFHCRGVFTLNILGDPVLLGKNMDVDRITAFGSEGSVLLTQKAPEFINWHDLDLKSNIKRRGVDDTIRLPYYPYRDDGLVLYDHLENMMREYVNEFYFLERNVREDFELQHFAAELSGLIRGFPSSFNSKDSLTKNFTTMLWLMVGQHAAINYPHNDYCSYIPNAPFKLYDVEGVADNSFSPERLENRITTAGQLSFVHTLSSFRMDRLFDYGSKLRSARGKGVVDAYKDKLELSVDWELKRRNRRRLREGHLTYPYFEARWLTNGIQS